MPIRGGLPPRNPRFVGREELLTRVRGLLGNGPVVLLPSPDHQLGGTGRTQLAIEYAYRHADSYELVWWIPAEQGAGMRAALAGLARKLGLPETRDLNRTLGAVRDALSRGEPFRHWLVVFENANRPEDIMPYLPSGAGHVLVTSRNPRWTAEVAQALPVPVLDRADATDLLRGRAPELSPEDADRLAARLGDVPIALDLAAAVRTATGWPVAEYLERYERRAAELAFPTPIRVTWGLAADALGEASPADRVLLELCTFLASAPISWQLLWAARTCPLDPEVARTVRVERRLRAAMRRIARFGLAGLDPSGERLTVHPLIRGMFGQELSSERHAELLRTVRAMLSAADPGDPDNPAGWYRYAELAPHLIHSDLLGGDAEEVRQLVINCIRFHYARGDYDSSRELAGSAVARWRDALGESAEQTLLASFHLANALRAVGRPADARALNLQTLRTQREVFGADDEATLATANSVGGDLRMQGHFGQARQLDADNLVRYRRLFGESFPTALRCANNLAIDLRLLGDFRGARALDEQTLRHRHAIFVDGHPETLASRAALAYDLFGLGDYAGVGTVLAGQAEQVAEDHPFALWAGRLTAMAAHRRGVAAAREMATENLAACRRRFGDLNVDTLATAVSLANCVRAAGDLAGAHELLERAVIRFHAVLGDEHPFTLAASAGLAGVVRAAGRYAEARTIDEEVLGGLRRSVGADHPFTLSCANGLAGDLFAAGEAQQARELAADTLRRSRVVRGADHPDTVACAWNLALADADETAQQQALTGLAKAYGDGHPIFRVTAAGQRLETDIDLPPL
ncbi:Nephrocystin-3 [Actinoplanes sp. SE50]|uniref:FxSxx-COOH system tetratricopeptide repeat protein n=1 Tax=unclassified Actinoplanes TaxID=2626549 RepID=UPI00023ECA80|nr:MULTISPECIES: FxSxx-COOH system tetratricopeptide repeat protein [unclassified Actinoplanes]AEV82030.1 Nephrocystin-3 [Actinoplanes sp. SE50/110]ATO80429.1 Nephrocystin-3 [Actinoplanes sp. SE50]SLL97836.1 Nephrocystin-3 [Actinoplanes sp. SE50/110]